MDQFTRRIIGFGVQAGDVDGIALCRLFNTAISTQGVPHYLSSDNDPLFRYYRWQANLCILDVTEIKSVPYLPLSHPFVERLIGTIRREYLDHALSGTPATWRESWKNIGTITTLIVCTPRSAAINRQKSAANPSFAAPISTNSSGNLIAVGYISCPLQPDQQFARHRTCSGTSREGSRHTTLQLNFTTLSMLQTVCRTKSPAKVPH